MSKILLFVFLCVFVNANENLLANTTKLALIMQSGDTAKFKNSLNEMVENLSTEIKNFNTQKSEFSIDLPKFLSQKVDSKGKIIDYERLRNLSTEQLKFAADPLEKLLKNRINSLDNETLQKIMNGKILLSEILENSDYKGIREIIFPLVADLSLNENFKKAYENLTENKLSSDFNAKFTDEFLAEIFAKAKKEERKFHQNRNAVFDVLKGLANGVK